MLISIVIPTVTGREDHLARCMDAYREHTIQRIELIVIRDRPTCGIAWQEGSEQASGDYLHLTADDLEPHHGWDRSAVHYATTNRIPCPTVMEPDGVTVQSTHGVSAQAGISTEPVTAGQEVGFTTVPFMTIGQWKLIGPMIPLHYCTDSWVSHRARLHGIPTVAAPGMRFTHHNALPGRGAGMGDQHARTAHDRAAYTELTA